MDIKLAGDMARELMHQHGLKDWTFTVDFAKRRFGQCRYRTKEISMSIPLIKLNTEEKVRDTILQEIAHALVGPRVGHTRVWREKAIAIGCDGNRCYGAEVIAPPKTWKGTCPTCGRVTHRYRRSNIACGKCCGKTYNPEHKFVWEKN
jgi:hypothetical protein